MKNVYFIVLAVALISFGCASKRHAKQGLKFEEAGMYEQAAESFYSSLIADPKNIDAAVGLKKNGQRLLDEKMLAVHKAYTTGDDKETVYKYLNAKAYSDKVTAAGVSLPLTERTEGFYKEAKPRYVAARYNEARLLLDEEKFGQANEIFSEVKKLEPSYQDIDEQIKISVCEPIYREGSQLLLNAFNRKAYEKFNSIITVYGTYKDAKDLRDEALNKGMITIAISPFANSSSRKDASQIFEGKISSALASLNNPFIRVVDIKNSKTFVAEQHRAINTGSKIEIGKMLAAKAILTGTVLKYDATEGKTLQEEKRGFIKEVITHKNKETGEETFETRYHKVTYNVVRKENRASIGFRYQLSSSETSSVLVADAMEQTATDVVNFATYQGNSNNLVPGYWEYSNKNSPKDKVSDSKVEIDNLQQLLKAKQTIKTVDALEAEIIDSFIKKVATKINSYNPEL